MAGLHLFDIEGSALRASKRLVRVTPVITKSFAGFEVGTAGFAFRHALFALLDTR